MAKLFDLNSYKKQRKRQFLEQNKAFLDDYIRGFILSNCQLSYDLFQQQYLQNRHQDNEMAWDYLDFRDTLSEVIVEVIGKSLWDDVQKQSWFKKSLLSQDEVMDRMISIFIIGAAVAEG